MTHRCLDEGERVLADGELVACLDVLKVPVLVVQSAQDALRLLRAVYGCVGNLAHQHGQCAAVVALAVVYHDGVDVPQVHLLLQMGHELLVVGIPYRVDEHRLLIPNQVGIVACAFVGGQFIAVEGLQFPVDFAYPSHFVGYFLSHNALLLIGWFLLMQRYNINNENL